MLFGRTRITLSFIALGVLLPACGGGNDSADYTTFDALSLIGNEAVPKGEYVIRNTSEYAQLLPYVVEPTPKLDFSWQMIVGISLGARGPCEWVEILDAQFRENQITVHYRRVFHWTGSSCISPFKFGTLGAFVIVPHSSKPVAFVQVE
jgi:hypothetical protein